MPKRLSIMVNVSANTKQKKNMHNNTKTFLVTSKLWPDDFGSNLESFYKSVSQPKDNHHCPTDLEPFKGTNHPHKMNQLTNTDTALNNYL